MDDEVFDIEDEAIRCWLASHSSRDEARDFDIVDAVYAANLAGTSNEASRYRFKLPGIVRAVRHRGSRHGMLDKNPDEA